MENIQNQENLDNFINEIFNVLESNNESNFVVVTPSIKNMIFTLYKYILKEKRTSKINTLIASLFQENFKMQLYKTNTSILEIEVSSFRYSIVNFQYLENYEKEILKHYFNILKSMLEIDFLRNEWVTQNSNPGRSIFSNYKIVEIQNLYKFASLEYEKIAEIIEVETNTIKGLKPNE